MTPMTPVSVVAPPVRAPLYGEGVKLNLPYKNQPVAKLIPYARNARTHSDEQVAQIAASIREFGFLNPVIVDEKGGIIAGHGRVLAARKLDLAEVPTVEASHLTEAQKRAYIIADNKLALNAGWDIELLRVEFEELQSLDFDIGLTGFSEIEIGELFPEPEIAPPGDPDKVPDPPPEPITRKGDLWVLGRHRLLCGDSTVQTNVDLLMAGEMADMVLTDPPYGVSYRGGGSERPIENDNLSKDDLSDFFLSFASSLYAAIKPGAPFYVFSPQGGEQMMMMMMMQKAGLPMRHELIWLKNSLVLGRADYHYKHEPILYGWKEGAAHPWYGGRDKTSIWEINKPSASKLHPTMKPIELLEIPLQNSSLPNNLILDIFGGSGSTLIACEKTGRNCRMIELSPSYCDVIVKRWEDYTGNKASLDKADGQG
jgi:DNA modification methylase